MKIFFNCLVYKDPDVVMDMVMNIRKFAQDPIIVLHVNSCFENFNEKKFINIPNLYINPVRFSHEKYDNKTKALMSNYNFLKNMNVDFDYQMFFYPKMLFIKNGIEKYIQDTDLCMFNPTLKKKEEMEFVLNSKMPVFNIEEKKYFIKGIEKLLIEGMVLSKTISDEVYVLIKKMNLDERIGHCLEEFIFPTLCKHFAENIKDCPGIVGLEFKRGEKLKKILNQEILFFDSFFIDNQSIENIFFIHMVDYDNNNTIRKIVRCLK